MQVLFAIALCIAVVYSFATTGIEMDGNTAGTNDWLNVIAGGDLNTGVELLSVNFMRELFTDPDNAFKGSNKDDQPISSWSWGPNQNVPGKNDLGAGVAASMVINNEAVISFATDLKTTNGDAFVGFWFFQNPIQLGNRGSFIGDKKEGDLLILVNIENSGPRIEVYKIGSDGKLIQSPIATGGECNSDPNQAACAISSLSSPGLPSLPGYPTATYEGTAFVEGSINLNKALPGLRTCFTKFLVESRSSTSITATLKDLIILDFNSCAVRSTVACPTTEVTTETDANGETLYKYTIVLTVKNAGGLSIPMLTVTFIPQNDVRTVYDFSSTQTFTFVVLTTDCDFKITQDMFLVQATSLEDSHPVISAQCNPAAPAISAVLDKNCNMSLVAENGRIVLRADWAGSIKNTGQASASFEVTDTIAGSSKVVFSGILKKGESAKFGETYYPSTVGSYPYSFSDTLSVTKSVSTCSTANYLPIASKTASCSVCR